MKPNIILTDESADVGERLLRKMQDTLALWNIPSIFPALQNDVRVTKDHPFALYDENHTDVFPSVCVMWTVEEWPNDILGRVAPTAPNVKTVDEVSVTQADLDFLSTKDIDMEQLTAKKTLDQLKTVLDASAPNPVFGSQESYYFNQTIEIAIWDPNGDVRTLLYKIARGVVLDFLRDLKAMGVTVLGLSGVPSGLYNFQLGDTPLNGAEMTLRVRNGVALTRVPIEPTISDIKKVIHSASDITVKTSGGG